jgi:hypothetical protein
VRVVVWDPRYLPFEGARAAVFGFFALIYVLLLCVHHDKLLPVHFAIVFVAVLSFFEAATW